MTLSEQLRTAILTAPMSRYAMSKRLGLSEAQLSRFVNKVCGLGLGTIDQIGQLLDLGLTMKDRPLQPRGRASRKGGA